MANRKPAHMALENIIKGRRSNLAIKIGPKKEVAKFKQPAPKLAHSASAVVRPAFSKIETE